MSGTNEDQPSTEQGSAPLGRRRVLAVLGAATSLAVVSVAARPEAASAANGDPLVLGQANSATSTTQLNGSLSATSVTTTSTLVANGGTTTDPAVSVAPGSIQPSGGSFTAPPEALRAVGVPVDAGGYASGRAGHAIVATGGVGRLGSGSNIRDVTGGTGVVATGGAGFATGNTVSMTAPAPTPGGAGVVATGGAGFAGGAAGIGVSGNSTDNAGVWGHSGSGVGVVAETGTGSTALSALGGRVMVSNPNAEYRLVGQEASGRTWRLFSDGTSFNFRDETGGQNILIIATDAVQFTKRLLPVGDAVPGMDVGIVGARWASVRAANVYSGDLHFQNGFRITEEGDGLAFMNPLDEKVAILDGSGNLRLKGKVHEGM